MRAGILIIATAAGMAALADTAAAEDKEPTAIVAIGGATEWALPGPTSFGPSVSVEFTPIRNWLEIEIGAATMLRRGVTEFETDLLFKMPFTLSDTMEFMVGAGPSWSYTRQEGTKWGATFAFELMLWPGPERKLGWFIEPTYTINQDSEKSLGVSVGLLIAIP
jgi:hypothetical protein